MADYIPSKDQDLAAFATNMSTKITASPSTYGLVVGDATALSGVLSSFTTALTAASSIATRTQGTVAAKNTARAVLVTEIRSLARRIQATPTVTAAQKTDLGLPVHDAVPTPVPPPATRPLVNLLNASSFNQTIRLADETTPSSRKKPTGTEGAEVYAFIGPTPPADLEEWEFKGLATKAEFTINYDGSDVGKQATIVARWYNRKGQIGPVSNPITGTIAA